MGARDINRADRQVREVALSQVNRRICRTPEECFQAGWDDGAGDPPLTPAQRTRLAALLGPSIREHLAEAGEQVEGAA